MTPDQIVHVVEKYEKEFLHFGGVPERYPSESSNPNEIGTRNHMLWMCAQTKVYAHSDMEKACRWLGFIQGILWATEGYSIAEMREDNR